MFKLLVAKIIESVAVSCGKIKVFLRDTATCLTCLDLIFEIFSALVFVDLIFTELDLTGIRSSW